jgi:hypothetical protein
VLNNVRKQNKKKFESLTVIADAAGGIHRQTTGLAAPPVSKKYQEEAKKLK